MESEFQVKNIGGMIKNLINMFGMLLGKVM